MYFLPHGVLFQDASRKRRRVMHSGELIDDDIEGPEGNT